MPKVTVPAGEFLIGTETHWHRDTRWVSASTKSVGHETKVVKAKGVEV